VGPGLLRYQSAAQLGLAANLLSHLNGQIEVLPHELGLEVAWLSPVGRRICNDVGHGVELVVDAILRRAGLEDGIEAQTVSPCCTSPLSLCS
jgi:hypothetical protein